MPSEFSLSRRVGRLENDVESIYEILTHVRSTLDDHTRRFDGIDQRLDRMDQRFDGVDQRLDRIDVTLAEIVRRLPEPV